MPVSYKHIILSFLFLLAGNYDGIAQSGDKHLVFSNGHPLLSELENAHRSGDISLEEKLLFTFYAGLQPGKLPDRLRPLAEMPIKCPVPAIHAYRAAGDGLSAAVAEEIESMFLNTPKQTANTFLSPSGRFLLHYEMTGEDAVPDTDESGVPGVPDYVERAAAAADSSWNHEVVRLGFSDPVIAGDPYDIHFRSMGFYGYTVIENNTTAITLHNNYLGFPENTDPEGNPVGAMKVTVAHELKHAIQYANSRWMGEAGDFAWSEMDATLMEEVVYDNVNDYYNYIKDPESIFLAPEESIPGAYFDVSWFIFYWEKYGSEFFVDTWQVIREDPLIPFLDALKTALVPFDESFSRSFSESHLWHYAAGDQRSRVDFGFEEREAYPSSRLAARFSSVGEVASYADTLAPLSANYLQVIPSGGEEGQPQLTLSAPDGTLNIGVVIYLKNGPTETFYDFTSSDRSSVEMRLTYRWNEIEQLGIAVSNSNTGLEAGYNVTVESFTPERLVLQQNYPNPFNPGTVIRFSLPQAGDVQLKVYDLTGRLIQTLVNGERPAGLHEVTFDGSRLASGIYFYQLVTGQEVMTRKMTLIK
ncbi:MAG: T9SS type A sorting domain-containing protein [Balneolaceae bacterium]|nr:T9SS type A sorting domain-containing protein [Balneolaceae bacterium]